MLYFENAKKCFASAVGTFQRDTIETDFFHRLAEIIPDKVDVDSLILAIKIVFQDDMRNGQNLLPIIATIPQYIRQCTDREFFHEFREKYIREILGLSKEPLPDVDYGCIEIGENFVDISNKNKYDVLAALYNASIPVGNGFAEYDPMPWTRETAKWYFEKYGQSDELGRVQFRWIFGRIVPCTFDGDEIYVQSYNYEHEDRLAQRVIATCPNIEKEKTL